MPAFALAFEWPATAKIPSRTYRLEAATAEDAAMQAALRFASEDFPEGLPTSYSVYNSMGVLVHHYPNVS